MGDWTGTADRAHSQPRLASSVWNGTERMEGYGQWPGESYGRREREREREREEEEDVQKVGDKSTFLLSSISSVRDY